MKLFVAVVLFAGTFIQTLNLEAKVTVAFLQVRNYHGQVVQLEPGGQFAHMAISFKGMWLHAHPLKGVELVSTEKLSKIGVIQEQIELSDIEELDETKVAKFLGKPFDGDYSWNDDAIYCAELVAKLLGLRPTPMTFDSALWPPQYQALSGKLGLSPDDIYQILSRR